MNLLKLRPIEFILALYNVHYANLQEYITNALEVILFSVTVVSTIKVITNTHEDDYIIRN